jgi:hypothetical protein
LAHSPPVRGEKTCAVHWTPSRGFLRQCDSQAVRDAMHPSRSYPLAGESPEALALSSPVASAMPARAAAPWEAAGHHLAGGRGARLGGRGRARAACGSRPGAGGRPAHSSWGLYPFGYRVYPNGVSGGRGSCASGGHRCTAAPGPGPAPGAAAHVGRPPWLHDMTGRGGRGTRGAVEPPTGVWPMKPPSRATMRSTAPLGPWDQISTLNISEKCLYPVEHLLQWLISLGL